MKKWRRFRRSPISAIAADITATVRNLSKQSPFVHPEIWARWFDIAGEQMYLRAFPRMLRNNTLIIGVANSSWLTQLTFLRQTLQDRLDEDVGPGVVTDIRFVLDPAVGKHRRVMEQQRQDAIVPPDFSLVPADVSAAASRIDDPALAEAILRAVAATCAKKN